MVISAYLTLTIWPSRIGQTATRATVMTLPVVQGYTTVFIVFQQQHAPSTLEFTGYVSKVCIFLKTVFPCLPLPTFTEGKSRDSIYSHFRKKTNNRVTHTHTHTHKHFRLYFRRSFACSRLCQKLGLAPMHKKKSTNRKHVSPLDISRPLTPASVVASQRYASATSKRPPYASCFTGLLKQHN